MSRKRSATLRSAKSPEADDLKLINGIGPSVEKRLNGVGIFTFMQLANLSPADIAATVSGITGLTTERIIKQNWIDQAHRLAAQSTTKEPDWLEQTPPPNIDVSTIRQKDAVEISVEAQYSVEATNGSREHTKVEMNSLAHAAFTVELQLDVDNEVVSTHVTNKKSADEKTWNGLPYAELLTFFIQSARLNLSQEAPSIAEHNKGDSTPIEEKAAALNIIEKTIPPPTVSLMPIYKLRARELKVLETGAGSHGGTLFFQQPFNLQLTIDLAGHAETNDSLPGYAVHFYARGREDHIQHMIGEAYGTIKGIQSAIITAQGRIIPRGIYRLEADVTLLPADTADAHFLNFQARVKGGMLLIS